MEKRNKSREESAFEIMRNMLVKGIDAETILSVVGLSAANLELVHH